MKGVSAAAVGDDPAPFVGGLAEEADLGGALGAGDAAVDGIDGAAERDEVAAEGRALGAHVGVVKPLDGGEAPVDLGLGKGEAVGAGLGRHGQRAEAGHLDRLPGGSALAGQAVSTMARKAIAVAATSEEAIRARVWASAALARADEKLGLEMRMACPSGMTP